MNLRQFYDTVIYRDLVHHILPGSIALLGVGVLGEAIIHRLGINASLLDIVLNSGWTGGILILGLAFMSGHALSTLFPAIQRRKQITLEYDTLASNTWLKQRVTIALAAYFDVPETQVQEWLENAGTVRVLREMGRQLAQENHPDLYQEFVGRYSVLSVFSLNMITALVWLLLSMTISGLISWDTIVQWSQVNSNSEFLIVLSVCVVAGVLLLARLYLQHAFWLRKYMIQHTFEIWCIDYFNKKKETRLSVPGIETHAELKLDEVGSMTPVAFRWKSSK